MSNVQQFLGEDLDLGLKVFTGSAVEAFRAHCFLFEPSTEDSNNAPDRPNLIYQQALSGAVSAQFLMYSDMPDAEEHEESGDELEGQQFEMVEGTITVDKPVVAHVEVPERHLELAQVNPLAKLGSKLGYSLAREYDKRLFRLWALGAREGVLTRNGLNIHNGATRVEGVHASGVNGYFTVDSTGAQRIRARMEEAAQGFDEKDVPEAGRFCIWDPYLRRVAMQDTTIFDVRYNNNENSNKLNMRAIGEVAGWKVYIANDRLPGNTNYTTGPTKYQGDFRYNGAGGGQPAMLFGATAMGEEAGIGTVVVKGVITESQKFIKKGTRFMKARIHMGADVMHPWFLGSCEIDEA